MNTHRLALFLALLAVLVLGLAACGDSGESEENAVIETIETALVKTDPRSCRELMTQEYLEQTFRTEGAASRETCEGNARGEESPNPPVEVSDVAIKGAKATANVSPAGGSDTQTSTVSLVKEAGAWKLNQVVRLVGFDRQAFLDEMQKGLESGEAQPNPEATQCILRIYRTMPRSELEETVLSGSSQREIEIFKRCN